MLCGNFKPREWQVFENLRCHICLPASQWIFDVDHRYTHILKCSMFLQGSLCYSVRIHEESLLFPRNHVTSAVRPNHVPSSFVTPLEWTRGKEDMFPSGRSKSNDEKRFRWLLLPWSILFWWTSKVLFSNQDTTVGWRSLGQHWYSLIA